MSFIADPGVASERDYAKLIKDKTSRLVQTGQSRVRFVRVVKVLAPLEASCERVRCQGSARCPHLRVDVLFTGLPMGRTVAEPWTARFNPGESPGEPSLHAGWLD